MKALSLHALDSKIAPTASNESRYARSGNDPGGRSTNAQCKVIVLWWERFWHYPRGPRLGRLLATWYSLQLTAFGKIIPLSGPETHFLRFPFRTVQSSTSTPTSCDRPLLPSGCA